MIYCDRSIVPEQEYEFLKNDYKDIFDAAYDDKIISPILKNRLHKFIQGEDILPFVFDTWEEGKKIEQCIDAYYEIIKNNTYKVSYINLDVINKGDVIQFYNSHNLTSWGYDNAESGDYNIISRNKKCSTFNYVIRGDTRNIFRSFTRLYSFEVLDVFDKQVLSDNCAVIKPLPFKHS